MTRFPKMESLQRPNLLINSDFKSGIINQKGQSSYNAIYQYGIDMWYMISSGTLKLNNNYITVSSDLKFFFDKQLPNGDYTFAVSVSGTIYKYTFIGFNGTSKTTNININGKTLGVEMISNYIVLYMNDHTFDIEFIKLEKGTCYTGMPIWNKADELNKCLYHFERINLKSWSLFSGAYVVTANNAASFPIFFKRKARTPIISINGYLKILFYTTWQNCYNVSCDNITTDVARVNFNYDNSLGRGNGTTCPICLVGDNVCVDIDAYNY